MSATNPIQTSPKIVAEGVDFHYGSFHALKDINVTIPEKKVTAFIGPSGCGKSTFLRCLNRMNDLIDGTKLTGKVTIDGFDIYEKQVDPVALRKQVGMVFQKPNPFPMSIFDNITYGPKL
jgi:phosphate transport system ATP-binding protein